MCMDARLGEHACFSRKFLETRLSEIASETILGQQQTRSSSICYIARGVLYPLFGVLHNGQQPQSVVNGVY